MAPRHYLICATPRSGSSFLCDGLRLLGEAGAPSEYLIPPYLAAFRAEHPEHTDADYRTVVAEILRRERARGLLAIKVMWEAWAEFLREFGTEGEAPAETIGRVMGPMAFVFIERRDVVRQAISHFKAEKTAVWFDYGQPITRRVSSEDYDFDRILHLARYTAEANQQWRDFFDRHGIVPLWVIYEELTADFAGQMGRVLAHLGSRATRPLDRQAIPLRVMADAVTDEFARRFAADCAQRGIHL